MINVPEHIDHLIVQRLTNEISAKDLNELNSWINSSKEHQKYWGELLTIWDASQKAQYLNEINLETNWKDIENKSKPVKTDNSRLWTYMRVAASIVLIGTMAYYALTWKTESRQIISQEGFHRLPDGSMVTLRKGASIEFDSYFQKSERVVSLFGDAYFEVVKNTDKPFLVNLKSSHIQVLGTSFGVKQGAQKTTVSLVEGKVSYHREDGQEVMLFPGEKLVDSNSAVHKTPTTLNEVAWKTQKLVFKETPLSLVLATLRDTYGLSYELETESIGFCQITSTYNHKNLNEIREELSFVLGLNIKQEHQKWIISGNGCARL